MRWTAIVAAALVLAGAAPPAAAAAIKSGRWQFVSRLEAGAPARLVVATPTPTGVQKPGGGATATYSSCIAWDKPLPAAFGPQCKLDRTTRNGTKFAWSMTCTNAESTVRSEGVAQYRGDRMDATMVSHLPAASGASTDLTQYITGRYLGPCLQRTDMPMTPSHPNAPPSADAAAPQPPNGPPDAASTAASIDGVAAPRLPDPPRRVRYARHRHYRHYRYGGSFSGWWGRGAYGGYGPGP